MIFVFFFLHYSAKTRIQRFHTELWTRCIPGSKDQHEQPQSFSEPTFVTAVLRWISESFLEMGDARMARFLANLALESRGI